ncbi:MAG TPA: NUDIX hydrolase [Longimicrobiales bacterium]
MEIESFDDVHDYGPFRVKRLVVRAPHGGGTHTYYVIDRRDSVQVVAITADGKMLMVEQERQGTRQLSLEFVAGLIDRSENPQAAAARELEEETGYRAQSFEKIGWYYTDPAILTNRVTVFLATGCTPSGKMNQDAGEDIRTRLFDVDVLSGLIAEGHVTHGLSVAAWHLFYKRVQRSRSRT